MVHYDAQSALPEDFKTAHAWMTRAAPIEEKITHAIRFVQDNIRYVADEIGTGSHIPRDPATVLQRSWGDCKDKSLLLTAILRELGVEAYVALTDNDSGGGLLEKLPSPGAFDHAITVIVKDGKRYWIDPTNAYQGGCFLRSSKHPLDTDCPFPRRRRIVAFNTAPAAAPQKILQETFDFASLEEDGLKLAVTSIFQGRSADSMRRNSPKNP